MLRVTQPPYTYPGFFQDIVPRLLDLKYGPDIAALINTCSIARAAPMKRSGIDWEHDITYRAWFDAKVKASDDPSFKNVLRKDNWLHRHMAAAFALKIKKRYKFFLEHRIPPLRCENFGVDGFAHKSHDFDPSARTYGGIKFGRLDSCKCGVSLCESCNPMDGCSRCDAMFCGGIECVDKGSRSCQAQFDNDDCLFKLCSMCVDDDPEAIPGIFCNSCNGFLEKEEKRYETKYLERYDVEFEEAYLKRFEDERVKSWEKAYEEDYILRFGEEWALRDDDDEEDERTWADRFTTRHMRKFSDDYDYGNATDKHWLSGFIDEFGKEFSERFAREWE